MTSSEPEPQASPTRDAVPDAPPIPAKPGRRACEDDMPPAVRYRDAHAPLGDQLAEPAWIGGAMLTVLTASRAFGGEWSAGLDPVLAALAAGVLVTAAAWSIRAAARRRRASPSARWLGDHPWRPDGGRSRVLSPMRQLVLAVTGVIAVAALSVTLLAGGGQQAVLVVTGIAALPFFVFLAFCVRPLLIGGVEVRWDEFPLMVGAKRTLRLRPTSPFTKGRLLLASVRWVWAPPPTPDGLTDPPITGSAGAWERLIELPQKDGLVELTLDLERLTAGTVLLPDCSLHWELVVTGDTKFGPIATAILLPIYADPAAAAGFDDRQVPATSSGSAARPDAGGGADVSRG